MTMITLTNKAGQGHVPGQVFTGDKVTISDNHIEIDGHVVAVLINHGRGFVPLVPGTNQLQPVTFDTMLIS